MAFSKIIESEGKVIIQTPLGLIENGTQKAFFLAYVKVVSIVGNKKNITASVNFKGDNQQFTKQYKIPVSVDVGSENFIKQVYLHLKTLPEFEGAKDC